MNPGRRSKVVEVVLVFIKAMRPSLFSMKGVGLLVEGKMWSAGKKRKRSDDDSDEKEALPFLFVSKNMSLRVSDFLSRRGFRDVR